MKGVGTRTRIADPRVGRLALAAVALVATTAGCHRPTPIHDIVNHPDQYRASDVRVHGRVVASFTLPIKLRQGFYVVSDGSGQVGVVSSAASPPVNSQVTVTGRLRDVPAVGLPAVKRFKVADLMIDETGRDVGSQR